MMVKYSENAEYPYEVVEKLKRFDLMKNYLKEPYGEGQNTRKLIGVILEFGRIDASLATLFLVQAILLGNTIDEFGSEFQKKELLPKIRKMDLVGGWGLTE